MSKEDSCIHYVVRFDRPTSYIYNCPYERAESRLAGSVCPFHMDKVEFTAKGMKHFNYVRSLTKVDLRKPLTAVEDALENPEATAYEDDNEFTSEAAAAVDLDALLEFESYAFEDIVTMQSYFVQADPDIVRQLLSDEWDKRRQTKGG